MRNPLVIFINSLIEEVDTAIQLPQFKIRPIGNKFGYVILDIKYQAAGRESKKAEVTRYIFVSS